MCGSVFRVLEYVFSVQCFDSNTNSQCMFVIRALCLQSVSDISTLL